MGAKSVLYNNVFVLNGGMETIGKLEAIAPMKEYIQQDL